MNYFSTIILFFCICPFLIAQNNGNDKFVADGNVIVNTRDSSSFTNSHFRQLDQTEVNLLFSYYEQEGDHAAVTGGTGSEELHDLEFGIVVNIPLDSISTLNFDGGLTSYTSASNDRINFRVSSASRHEFRGRVEATYTRQQLPKRTYYGLSAGFSGEVDYISSTIGAKWGITSIDNNRSFEVAGKYYFDIWVWLIYPEELRFKKWADTKIRETYNLSFVYSQVLNPRLQTSLFAEGVYQTGLLSIPFHRVYFAENNEVRVENLPKERFKLPLGIRLNYYLNDLFVLRTYYRYYRDSFDIEGHTASIEVPIQINPFLSFAPFYRYHYQTASKYFAPFKTHELDANYYSSDYDLSALSSHKVGFGIRYAPLYGVGRFKTPFAGGRKATLFEGVDFRAAYYRRSDGLSAFLLSLGLDFLM
ncbi:MAG: DUF3570 domain-containing protein [Chitinophagales bacterium]